MTSAGDIAEAVAALARGEVIGLPTETVYGLAADAANPHAVARIFAIKGRPRAHPLILHLGASAWLERYVVEVPETARRLSEKFWPGPLTMILVRNRDQVSDAVTGGLETVAVRVPAHPVALEVLAQLGRPVAAPSANRFGAVSPTTRQHVLDDLGDLVAVILDGGACEVGLESTIVDLTSTPPRLLRPGGVSRQELEDVLGSAVLDADNDAPAAPGTLESHYAPRARVTIVEQASLWDSARRLLNAGTTVGVIAAADFDNCPAGAVLFRLGPGANSQAHRLYEALRTLDAQGCDEILTTLPPPDGLGAAVADRLVKAAAPRPLRD